MTDLDKTKPDFEDLVTQIQNELKQKDNWNDILAAGIGETLIENIAAIGAYDQLSIERAERETWLDTARIPSSVFSIARSLGVHVNRKKPALVEVVLKKSIDDEIVEIPEYTQFFVDNNIPCFNREKIIINETEEEKLSLLYQGEIFETTFESDGSPYQRFSIDEKNFAVSNTDIKITNNDKEFKLVTDGLWRYREDERVFYENTLPDGSIEILFGNGIFGKIPSAGSDINVLYVITLGENGNDSRSGLSVTSEDSIEGFTKTPLKNGENEDGIEFYKLLAPDLYSSKKRAVSKKDHKALVVSEYPGVIDAVFRAQRDIDPSNKNLMNVVYVTLLTKSKFSLEDWKRFEEWMNERQIEGLVYVPYPSNEYKMNIQACVYANKNSRLKTVKSNIELKIKDYFLLRLGSLGFSVYLNDIHHLIKESDPNVNYVELFEPTYSFEISETDYITLGDLNITMEYSLRNRIS